MVTRGQLRLPALSAFFLQIFVGSRGVLGLVAPSSPHFLPTNPSGSRSGAPSGQRLSPSGLVVNSLKKLLTVLERALPARSREPAGQARPGVHRGRDHTKPPGRCRGRARALGVTQLRSRAIETQPRSGAHVSLARPVPAQVPRATEGSDRRAQLRCPHRWPGLSGTANVSVGFLFHVANSPGFWIL